MAEEEDPDSQRGAILDGPATLGSGKDVAEAKTSEIAESHTGSANAKLAAKPEHADASTGEVGKPATE